jgi:hypothetical protein
MAIPSIESVVPHFQPHYPLLLDVLQEAIDKAKRVVRFAARKGVHYSSRVKSQIFTATVVEVAKLRLTGSEVRYVPGPATDLDLFRCGPAIFLWKKSAPGRRAIAQNHESERQNKLRWGGGLLGFPKAPFVHVVFRMDDAFDHLIDVSIACPKGYDSNAWSDPLLEAAKGTPVMFPMPEQAAKETRVESKTKLRKKKGGGHGGGTA